MDKDRHKKVLFIVVDAIASRVVRPAMERGELPHFKTLADHGEVPDLTAIFPSITPAATAGLVTGEYPGRHGVAGAYWYEESRDEVAYYGDDFWAILREGLNNFVRDFLVRLNFERLRAPTAFEVIAERGRTTGCLNYLWFRGNFEHEVNPPWWLRWLPSLAKTDRLNGPEILVLGDFVSSRLPGSGKKLSAPGVPWRRLGFDDKSTSRLLLKMSRRGELPDFTLAYFPDNDFQSHTDGPRQALSCLKGVDATLGELFQQWGSHERMLDDVAVVITGDHSQSDLLDDDRCGIHLSELLDGVQIVKAGETWHSDDQIMVCPNMRAVQVYFRRDSRVEPDDVADALIRDERVDQAIRLIPTGADGPAYRVTTRDRGTLDFKPGRGEGVFSNTATDNYGNLWSWDGELAAIDAGIGPEGTLTFGDYPNALERIATSFADTAGQLWATARLGHEFELPATSTHRRGSHGSLHEADSTSPLFVAGHEPGVVPELPRAVDVAWLCYRLLGLDVEPPARGRAGL
jgi:arylsulfatase A-like enzyme